MCHTPEKKWEKGKLKTLKVQKHLTEINMSWCDTKRAAQNQQKWKRKADAYAFHLSNTTSDVRMILT